MSVITEALQPYLFGELTKIGGRTKATTLAELVVSPALGYDVTYDNSTKSVLLDFRYAEHLSDVFAADCSRFSSAAFQSISTIPNDIQGRDGVAWSLIKLYYSAFYAAHALIRVFGQSCSYLENSQVAAIDSIGAALGRTRTFKLEGGLFHATLQSNAMAVSLKQAGGRAGGSHVAFWDVFGKWLLSLGPRILTGPLPTADAQAVFAKLEEARVLISRTTSHSWLSVLRNDLQYKHRYGVWYPNQVRPASRAALGRLVQDWLKDPMDIELDPRRVESIGEFASCCTFIVALTRIMLVRIRERSAVGARSFVVYGPLAYLNDIRLGSSA